MLIARATSSFKALVHFPLLSIGFLLFLPIFLSPLTSCCLSPFSPFSWGAPDQAHLCFSFFPSHLSNDSFLFSFSFLPGTDLCKHVLSTLVHFHCSHGKPILVCIRCLPFPTLVTHPGLPWDETNKCFIVTRSSLLSTESPATNPIQDGISS